MCDINNEKMIDQLDPTFLFIWKGTRVSDEENYHSHDYIEMAYVLSGEGRYRIDDAFYEIGEGDILILNPGVKHQALVSNPVNPTTEVFIGFCDIELPGLPANHFPLPDDGIILHTTGELHQRVSRIFTAMYAENGLCRTGRYVMLKSYLMQLLILLLRRKSEPVAIKTGCSFDSLNRQYLVEQIVGYFEEHYAEKISLDQIAENMYLSPFYISRIFKSETGETPIRHLIDIRLERARELLEENSHDSIQEIAAQVGYDDAYHFSKLFKKKYGCSPSKIRKA